MSAWTKLKTDLNALVEQGHEAAVQHGEQAVEHAAEHGAGHGETLGEVLMHHVSNSNKFEFFFMEFDLPEFHLFGIDLSITKHVLMIWLAVALMMTVFTVMLRWKNMVPKGIVTGMFEPIILFVRDEIVYKNFGQKDGRKFVPFFLTVFFFILLMNLIGLVPFMATATGNVTVTGSLAAVTFLLIHMVSIVHNGFFHHWKNFMPPGVPWPILIILFPVEIIGTVGRCFALMIRLFASMTAGHFVLFAFLGLPVVLGMAGGMFVSLSVGAVAVPLVLVILGLEIFFAFLQAYIFTFLSALFISMTYHAAH